MSKTGNANRYARILEYVFLANYRPGASTVAFGREELERASAALEIELPKNLGDLIYTFRFRGELPESIQQKAPKGKSWVIRLAGRSRYCFAAAVSTSVVPRSDMSATKVPDATPGLVVRYALNDEQALLAILRHNRLVDVFTGVACYSLQSHLRTTVVDVGQVETDEVYIGVDRRGAQYVFPVQAKGGRDKQNVVQIEQDIAMCREKFPDLICRPIAAQFMPEGTIALLELEHRDHQVTVASEKHYRLVPQDQISSEELEDYRRRTE